MPAKDLPIPPPERFMMASLIEFEAPETPEPEPATPVQKPPRPPQEQRQEREPERFRRPEERYEAPKDEISTRQVIEPVPESTPQIQEERPDRETRAPVRVLERDFQSNYYLGLLRDKVYRNWHIQDRPFRMECIVRFQINRNGNVENIRLEQSSGFHEFDRAAIRAISASDPFAPLPSSYTQDRITVYFKFENF